MLDKCFKIFGIVLMLSQPLIAQNLGRIQRGQRGYTPPPTYIEASNPTLANAIDVANEKMPVYIEKFKLDDFEAAVFKNMLVGHETKMKAINENPSLDYYTRQEVLTKQLDAFLIELKTILSPEEILEFPTIQFDKRIGKKKKKKKKKKRSKKKKS